MPHPPRSEYAFVILLVPTKGPDEKPSPMNIEPPTERLSVSSIATDGIASSMSRYDAEPLLSGALTKFVPAPAAPTKPRPTKTGTENPLSS